MILEQLDQEAKLKNELQLELHKAEGEPYILLFSLFIVIIPSYRIPLSVHLEIYDEKLYLWNVCFHLHSICVIKF